MTGNAIRVHGLTRRQYRARAEWQWFHDAAQADGANVADEPQGGWEAFYARTHGRRVARGV